MRYVERVCKKLNELCQPNQAYEQCHPYIQNIKSDTIMAVLPLVRYNVDRVAQYLLCELAEEQKLAAFEEKLREFCDTLPKDGKPKYFWPNPNQQNSLLHYEDRTFTQAIATFADMCEVLRQIYQRTQRTLSYDDTYALLRRSSWKVDTAVASYIDFLKSYAIMKREICHRCHAGDYTEIDYEFARCILRRSNCNTGEAVEDYCQLYQQRVKKAENFKQELVERGFKKFPTIRAMYYHLADNFWDFDVARDRWDYEALVNLDNIFADYQRRYRSKCMSCKSQPSRATVSTTFTNDACDYLQLSPVDSNFTTTTPHDSNTDGAADTVVDDGAYPSALSEKFEKPCKLTPSSTKVLNDTAVCTKGLTIVIENDELSPTSCPTTTVPYSNLDGTDTHPHRTVFEYTDNNDRVTCEEVGECDPEIGEEADEIREILPTSMLYTYEMDESSSTTLMVQQ
uniref:Uncharacterized protein n=1 Tax=Lygus hesperus TaxID=30085 RepID=A0A0A9Y9L7_LYGHE